MKGMIASIYRNAELVGDLNLLSQQFKRVLVVDNELPGIFDLDDDMLAVRLVRRTIRGAEYIHAVPLQFGEKHSAFGGSFLFTSDSRLRKIAPYPIPIHDVRP